MLGNLKSERGHTPWDYGDTVVTLLHTLIDTVKKTSEKPVEEQINFQVTLAQNATYDKLIVPEGQTWVLQTVVAEIFTAATIVRIMNAADVWNPPANVPVPWFIWHPGVDDTKVGCNVQFPGGTQILIVADGDGMRLRLFFDRQFSDNRKSIAIN